MRRRTFLIGVSAAAKGSLVLGYRTWSNRFESRARALTTSENEALLCGWAKIASDNDTVTVYLPHVGMDHGSRTALAMMFAEELDAEWPRVRTEQVPADSSFAHRFLAESWVLHDHPVPTAFDAAAKQAFTSAARLPSLPQTGGSMAAHMTRQVAMRLVGAAARSMLIQTAARRWGLPPDALATAHGAVHHATSGRHLRYTELAEEAASLAVPAELRLKSPSDFRLAATPSFAATGVRARTPPLINPGAST